jgi:hypothetical protein
MVEQQEYFVVEVRDDGGLVWNGNGIANMLSSVCYCTPNQALDALAALQMLGDLTSQRIDLQNTVNELHDGPRCCGHQWRNKAGRLYMHHSLNEDCPMHGQAPDGADRGLRSYIGADDEADVLKAAADFELWKIRKSELKQLEHKLNWLAHQLKGLGR